MQVFSHHLYEFKKGVRRLILHTTRRENEPVIRRKLEQAGIRHLIYPNGASRINVFFGDDLAVDMIERIGKPDLRLYTHEEDFILGVLLGYDLRVQCSRYLERTDSTAAADPHGIRHPGSNAVPTHRSARRIRSVWRNRK